MSHEALAAALSPTAKTVKIFLIRPFTTFVVYIAK